jgi:hypothetical protein
MPSFAPVTETDVRDYLQVTGTSGEYSSGLIGSNIRTAAAYLQRITNRLFEPQEAITKTFSTNGAASIQIPDLRTFTSVTLNGSTLEQNSTFWGIEDAVHSGTYIGVQLRAFSRHSDYRAYPDWFDRNLDQLWRKGGLSGGLPNDLAIEGDWGHDPQPDEFLTATKALAAWYTVRPDAALSGGRQTPEGNTIDLSQVPDEVALFIEAWSVGPILTGV